MAGPILIPKGMSKWPERATGLSVKKLIKTYEDGFCGAYHEPEETEKLKDDIKSSGGLIYGSDIAHQVGFADSGKGKLSIPFVFTLVHFPGSLPGPAQERGDCVSHDQKNANMGTYACEIQHGIVDEVTGKKEEAPKISATGLKQGAFSTEVFYWFRRHGGDGWSCDAAARVSMKEAGLVPRQDFSDSPIDTDLTRYSGRNAGKYGRTPPSGAVADALDNNLIRQATTINSLEEIRDFVNNGYMLSTCGMQGYSNKRNEHGVSSRTTSWAHAMAVHGFDDREWAHRTYGGPLILVQNSWAIWNSGPRDIYDSAQYVPGLTQMTGLSVDQLVALDIVNSETGNVMIPHGAFWSRAKDYINRTFIAKASVNGWIKKDVYVPAPFDGVI